MNIGAKIRNALSDAIRLGRVTRIDNTGKLQKVTVDVRVGVIDNNVARVQNYGFSSTPDAQDELLGVEITCNGNRFVIALDDLTNRPAGGEAGDVRVYHREGHFICLTKEKIINLECEVMNMDLTMLNINGDITHNGNTTHTGDTEHTGNLTQTGDVDLTGDTAQTGTITATVDVIANYRSLVHHDHDYNPGPLPTIQTGEANI